MKVEMPRKEERSVYRMSAKSQSMKVEMPRKEERNVYRMSAKSQ
jgi:hypothetical protein